MSFNTPTTFQNLFRRNLGQADSVFINAYYPVRYHLACVYARLGQAPAALEQLELALKMGSLTYEQVRKEPDLASLRRLAGYKALLKKYFPGQYKE